MLTRDLIKVLEELDKNDPIQPSVIAIDTFRSVGDGMGWDTKTFTYCGIDFNVRITRTEDGVYPVLTAFEE